MNVRRMVLVGHSLGGIIAVAYAQLYPDRVEHLILASPAHAKEFEPGQEPPSPALVAWVWNRGVRALRMVG